MRFILRCTLFDDAFYLNLFKALFILFKALFYSKLYFIQSFILFKAFYSTPLSNHFQTAFIHFFQILKTLSKI